MLNSVRYGRVRRPRVQRRLAPAAGGADDHRRVRPAQDQRRDVDDVRHRHVRAAGDRELDLEGRRQRRQQDQEERAAVTGVNVARGSEHAEGQRAERDDRRGCTSGRGAGDPGAKRCQYIVLDNVQTFVLYICLRQRHAAKTSRFFSSCCCSPPAPAPTPTGACRRRRSC